MCSRPARQGKDSRSRMRCFEKNCGGRRDHRRFRQGGRSRWVAEGSPPSVELVGHGNRLELLACRKQPETTIPTTTSKSSGQAPSFSFILLLSLDSGSQARAVAVRQSELRCAMSRNQGRTQTANDRNSGSDSHKVAVQIERKGKKSITRRKMEGGSCTLLQKEEEAAVETERQEQRSLVTWKLRGQPWQVTTAEAGALDRYQEPI